MPSLDHAIAEEADPAAVAQSPPARRSPAASVHSARMNKPWSQGKRRGGGLSRVLREQKARLYIIRRCVVMLLCYHD
ncbi:uncharacterized protein LOC120667396 isoform X1 [Panicum virgatum]|uniref:Uncharacterized protein n=1 Tax=Panicum virgatum TaxID=38727 RepID=A0A8T0U6V2_PANVG|nr:uncharacterized protein LOC120667396 isoform X1 [Panicum virgatum]KAG2617758.1 hypothetical protein PVAP13_3NG183479 [Panicum virgatum]